MLGHDFNYNISQVCLLPSSRDLHCPIYLLSERNAEPKLTFGTTFFTNLIYALFIIYSYCVVILVQSFEYICKMVVYSYMSLYVYDISPYFDTGPKQNYISFRI